MLMSRVSLRFNDLVVTRTSSERSRFPVLPFRSSTYNVYWGNSADCVECWVSFTFYGREPVNVMFASGISEWRPGSLGGDLSPLDMAFLPFAHPPADVSFVLFYRDPIQQHFLICFFLSRPSSLSLSLSLARSTDISKMRLSR